MDSCITFRENVDASKKYKEEYVFGINKLIEAREKEFSTRRSDFCKKNFFKSGKVS